LGTGDHLDAARHRTHDLAEVAADTLGLVHEGHPGIGAGVNTLVGPVVAGRDTQLAADALVGVDLGDRLVVEVELTPLAVGRDRLADELIEVG
jgi:hypothetical protein